MRRAQRPSDCHPRSEPRDWGATTPGTDCLLKDASRTGHRAGSSPPGRNGSPSTISCGSDEDRTPNNDATVRETCGTTNQPMPNKELSTSAITVSNVRSAVDSTMTPAIDRCVKRVTVAKTAANHLPLCPTGFSARGSGVEFAILQAVA